MEITTIEDFDTFIDKPTPVEKRETVLVDFWADWCAPCKMLAPTLDTLSEEGVRIAKVDIEEFHDIATSYFIRSIPCVLAFRGGKEVARLVGVNPIEKYRELLETK